jgi:hypothetical protein
LLWIKRYIIIICFWAFSCELHDPIFDNSLDLEVAAEKGIYPPALVFFPNNAEVTVGDTVEVEVYAMKIENVGMAQIQVHYEANKLSVESVTRGSLFQGGNQPFFITDNDTQNGVLTIYITFLGPDGNAVGGTGDIALIHFKPRSTGNAEFRISQESILLDPDANTITLNGYGKGMIDAR